MPLPQLVRKQERAKRMFENLLSEKGLSEEDVLVWWERDYRHGSPRQLWGAGDFEKVERMAEALNWD